MKTVTVEEKEPIPEEWYMVRCPNFSESGWEIAQWNNGEWCHGHFSQSVNDYVVGYIPLPLSEW